MEDKVLEPLKCYRGGEEFVKYCFENNILADINSSNTNVLCYIENNKVIRTFSINYDSLFLDRGLVIEVPLPRWRAKEGDFYWFVRSNMKVERERDERDSFANILYDAGNYFASEAEAEKKLKEIKEILKK